MTEDKNKRKPRQEKNPFSWHKFDFEYKTTSVVYVGIDLALSSTGVAVINSEGEPIAAVRIITTKSDHHEDERIIYICNAIESMCSYDSQVFVAMEDQHGGLNSKTTLQLSRVRGAVMAALRLRLGVSIKYYSPSEIKFGLCHGVKTYHPDGRYKSIVVTKEMISEKMLELLPCLESKIGEFSDKPGKKKTSDVYDAFSIAIHLRNEALKQNG